MSRILVLCDAAGGPVETLAVALADGAREAGAEVRLGHISDRASRSASGNPGGCSRPLPAADVDALVDYDAIVFGVGGAGAGEVGKTARFLDRAEVRRPGGALSGKVGAAFSATREREEEGALMAIHARLMRLGLVCVGPPCGLSGRMPGSEAVCARPGGATSAFVNAPHAPGADALADARALGRHVAGIAGRLFPVATLLGESEQTEHFLLQR